MFQGLQTIATLVNYTCRSFIKLTPGLNVVVKRATSLLNLFCSNVARQVARFLLPVFTHLNKQRKLCSKMSAHSDLSPNLELPTPTESRHITCLLEGKCPSVKLMSRKKKSSKWTYCKLGLARTNLKNMDRTIQNLQRGTSNAIFHPSLHERVIVATDGRTDDYVTTKISWMH